MRRINQIVLLFTVLVGVVISSNASARVPDLIPVQGLLANAEGTPIDGEKSVQFALYAESAGGSPIWSDTFDDLKITEGLFTVYLGSGEPLNFASLAENNEVWLGVTVASDEEMDRIRLAAVPYAIEAKACGAVGELTEQDIRNSFASTNHNHDQSYAPKSHGHSLDCTTVTAETKLVFDYHHAEATCPSGYVLTGGGHGIDQGHADISSPRGNGWYVYAHKESSGDSTLTAYARCCKL